MLYRLSLTIARIKATAFRFPSSSRGELVPPRVLKIFAIRWDSGGMDNLLWLSSMTRRSVVPDLPQPTIKNGTRFPPIRSACGFDAGAQRCGAFLSSRGALRAFASLRLIFFSLRVRISDFGLCCQPVPCAIPQSAFRNGTGRTKELTDGRFVSKITKRKAARQPDGGFFCNPSVSGGDDSPQRARRAQRGRCVSASSAHSAVPPEGKAGTVCVTSEITRLFLHQTTIGLSCGHKTEGHYQLAF